MNILGIDCSTSLLSVSLKSGEKLYESSIHDGFKHSENLMVQIDHLFSIAGLSRSELDLIAVAAGPGSFTGLRIAMSTAKGLAMGAEADLVSLSTLDVYAEPLKHFEGVVIPVIDARKKRLYAAMYKSGEKISKELDIEAEKLIQMAASHSKILITGPDSHLFEKISLNDSRIIIDKRFSSVTATPLINLGLKKYKDVGPDPHGSGPVYIRKSEAELSMFGE